MKPNEAPASGGGDRFRTTHWSVIKLSAQRQVPGSRTAVANLCKFYQNPLYTFVQPEGPRGS